MRVVFANFGTLGDFRPLLALAWEFRRRGSTPVLAFPPFARDFTEGFEFRSVGPDLAGVRDEINADWAARPDHFKSPEAMLESLVPLCAAFPQVYDELSSACRDADVLVAGAVQPVARMVHETLGIPFVSVQVAHFGGSGGGALRYAGSNLVNPFRRRLGLPDLDDPLTSGANSPQLALYAMSKYLYPKPAHWPNHYHVVGFFLTGHRLPRG